MAYREMDAALREIPNCLCALNEADEAMYGGECENNVMKKALAAMNRCFDFHRLVESRPLAEDTEAFKTVVKLF